METKVTQKLIKPQTLKGFRDFLPEEMRLRNYVIDTFKKVFEAYGYEPLETPALEYTELMLGISGEEAEKQFFRFKDQGDRDVMMRFEVMVPMCRVIAQYKNKIVFPFKRYQIQRVWRAEKPQKGRLREFTQCDADTIGSDSMRADAEFIQMGTEVMQELGFKDFATLISNRKFLSGLVKFVGADPNLFYGICVSIDKLKKIGEEGVREELTNQRKVPSGVADKILKIISTSGNNQELVTSFKKQMAAIPEAQEGLTEIQEIFDYFRVAGVEEKYYRFDPTISRGLAHYTGPIWEVEVLEGGVGSVAGCGRYDDVIGQYLGGKETIPATGGSFGVERLMEIIKDRQMVQLPANSARVLVTIFEEKLASNSVKTAVQLRKARIPTFLYPDGETRLDKQLKYADRKRIPFVVIIGPEEARAGQVTLKDLEKGTQETDSLEKIIKALNRDHL